MFEIKCASVSHVAHVEESLCQEGTENGERDIKCIEGYTIASNTLKCKAVDSKTALGSLIGNVSCTSKSCGVPSSIANALHTSVERYYLDFATYIYKFGYSLNGLRCGKKEFLLVCKSHGTYDVPHLTCQPNNCILEDALIAKTIKFSGGSLGPNEWLKYQCGDGHTLSEIPDSSDLFTATCLDGDHAMTHCKPVQCGDAPVIVYATPLGGCFVTVTYGKQVEYQREAGYHVESERKSGSKPEGCMRRSVLSQSNLCRHQKSLWVRCRVVDTSISLRRDLPHGSVSRIGLSRPTNGFRTGAAPDGKKCLIGQFLSRALQARVRRMPYVSSSAMSEEPSWSVTREKWKNANSRN